jgi:flap endonuclease-1
MGIKHLNKLLLTSCSKEAISKVHLREFEGKTVVIDASIYMYKFISENTLIESMYLLISILKHYKIKPIFVFDGKPPPEKKALLIERSNNKKKAYETFLELKNELSNNTETGNTNIVAEMEKLKKQFMRISDEQIASVKELLTAYGVEYYVSPYEADQICIYFTKIHKAWACISEDMDMFLYGCPRVLRGISLMNHTVIYYDYNKILRDLNMSDAHFREVLVLSGTDYNTNMDTNLYDSMKLYKQYKKSENSVNIHLYDWLLENTNYIKDVNELYRVYNMFLIENYDFLELPENDSYVENRQNLEEILEKEGFVFVHKD